MHFLVLYSASSPHTKKNLRIFSSPHIAYSYRVLSFTAWCYRVINSHCLMFSSQCPMTAHSSLGLMDQDQQCSHLTLIGVLIAVSDDRPVITRVDRPRTAVFSPHTAWCLQGSVRWPPTRPKGWWTKTRSVPAAMRFFPSPDARCLGWGWWSGKQESSAQPFNPLSKKVDALEHMKWFN